MLFGDRFAKEAKEREDQLRALDRATGSISIPKASQSLPSRLPTRGRLEPELSRRSVATRGRF